MLFRSEALACGHTPVGPYSERSRWPDQRDRLLAGWKPHSEQRHRWHRAALARRESGRSRRGHKNKKGKPIAMNSTCVIRESQRDSVPKPRVAESARLPWDTCRHASQPRRGCVHPRVTNRHNPVGVEILFIPVSQGSSCLSPSLRYGAARATLGFEPESRWDSATKTKAEMPSKKISK